MVQKGADSKEISQTRAVDEIDKPKVFKWKCLT